MANNSSGRTLSADDTVKIRDLRNRILAYLDRKEILSNDEVMSFYDIVNACNKEFIIYTRALKDLVSKKANKINNKVTIKNVFLGNKPYIVKVTPGVKDNNTYINIDYANCYRSYSGTIQISDKLPKPILLKSIEGRFTDEELESFMSKCNNEFKTILSILNKYNNIYHTDFSWIEDDYENIGVLRVRDELIEGCINLSSIYTPRVYLFNIEDDRLSKIDSPEFSELEDYIEFYNQGMQKRLPVNINELNPLYRKIIENHYDFGNQRSLKR